MTNIFFKDETITEDDLYFVCYMIESVARQLKQSNKYVVNQMGYEALCEKLSLANVLHSDNPQAVCADWISTYHMEKGVHDVTNVDHNLCEEIPTSLQMGKVYMRLILATMSLQEDYAQAILRVYNSSICETLDNYNCSAYYEPSPYIARSYFAGGF
ncbi:MAG: hypothetical protein IJ845_11120 [Bacteroidaceae bacterium]|nr:hypothetical protein [Bacteroidaceae bacterium]